MMVIERWNESTVIVSGDYWENHGATMRLPLMIHLKRQAINRQYA